MSRPNEGRVKVTMYIFPAVAKELRRLASLNGSIGKVVETLFDTSPVTAVRKGRVIKTVL